MAYILSETNRHLWHIHWRVPQLVLNHSREVCIDSSCKIMTSGGRDASGEINNLQGLEISPGHKKIKSIPIAIRVNGWYPELVFLSVVFSNSTSLVVVILNSSVLKIYIVAYTFENQYSGTYLPLLGR